MRPGPRCVTHDRAAKRARKKAAHEKMVGKRYGLGPGDYDRLHAFQDGVCFICRRKTGARKRLPVDHDHATGEARGLLCTYCNRYLGHALEDPEVFKRAIEYLADPPARRLFRSL